MPQSNSGSFVTRFFITNLFEIYNVGTNLSYSSTGTYKLPKPLSGNYRFIMITIGESNGNFRTNSIVRYVDKNKTHFILGVSISPQDEVISFNFKDDNTFEILSYTPTGVEQINILEIYQFN